MFGYFVQRYKIRMEGEHSASFGLVRSRMALLSGFFILAYVVLAIRAFDLTILQGQLSPERQASITAQSFVTPAPDMVFASGKRRGDILDRNGVLVATTLKVQSLYADALHISNPALTARQLVEIFPELSYNDVFEKLESGKRFVWLKREVMPDEQEAVLEIGEPGLAFQEEDRRMYPNGGLAAHIIGYTSIDNHGLSGIERSFDQSLSKGENLSLSLDIRLQHALQRTLEKSITDFNAKAGAGVIMDVETGEILAGVSLPTFNLNKPDMQNKDAIFNRLTLGVYELGSVFKIFSTAALLDLKEVPLATKFDAREPLESGRFKIRDYHAEKRILTIPEVFMYSSNIGSAMMGQALGTEALRNFYEDLGLLTPLDFEVREVGHPLVPHPWRDLNTLTASYGHGVATTPVQVSSAVASLVNGGYLVRPTLIKTDVPEAERPRIRVVSQDTSDKMRQLLRLVVTDGTAKKADVPGFFVGGKTGTAEKPGKNGYDRNRLISSFVGVFPANNPKYLIFTMVDEPKGNKKTYGYATAGWVAAPMMAEVVKSMASILGLVPVKAQTQPDPADAVKHYITFEKEKHG